MSTVSAPAFGVLLRRFRQAAGFTQEGLAERAGLSPEGISALERGVNRSPRKDTIALLADALALGTAERALLEAAARKRTTSSPPGLHPPRSTGEEPAPLVGREHELARVVEHLSGDGPAALLITGEPGIGKSRLLKEAADRAVAAGWNVLWGGCRRRGSQEPFAPLLGVLEQ
ncbi:MAG TPA: helix-turn-helix domain-containing protein, partial [Ktedonobacterales bacterium]|nr:helix-turn-helix domain-containing protein [Ktedonobacterales bacterium]